MIMKKVFKIPMGKLDKKELNCLGKIRKNQMKELMLKCKTKEDLISKGFPKIFIDKHFDNILKSITE